MLVCAEISIMLDKARGGYFRTGEESHFPWDRETKEIWYAVLYEGRYTGFKSTNNEKKSLIRYLKMAIAAGVKPLVIGIWHGKWSTHLFVLDPSKTINYLTDVTLEADAVKTWANYYEPPREKTWEERFVFSAYD
jgi:hypothetical protein